MVLGIDEAGRGPVIGPMVICGVLASEETIKQLQKLGVKDSKQLSRKRRKCLQEGIINVVEEYVLIEIAPCEIDSWLSSPGLNSLEAEKTAEIIRKLKPRITYLDAPGKASSYAKLLRSILPPESCIVAENFADQKYPIVSAASILAKVRRDEIIEELHQQYNADFGSGYPGDKKTREFLIRYYQQNGNFPDIVRTKWATIRKLIASENQCSLNLSETPSKRYNNNGRS
jgi:ribonuclease HII